MKPKTAQIIRLSLLFLLGVTILLCAYWLRAIFNPLLAAGLIAYMLNPIVNWMEQKGLNRTAAIVLLYGFGALMILGALAFAIPLTYTQVSQLAAGVVGEEYEDINQNGQYDPGEPFTDERPNGRFDPGYADRALAFFRRHIERWNVRHQDRPDLQINFPNLAQRVRDTLRGNLSAIATRGLDWSSWLLAKTRSGITWLMGMVTLFLLIPIYVFFLLRGMNRIRDVIYAHLPAEYRDRTIDILRQIHLSVSSFFRGRLILCACVAILTAVGLLLCRVRFSILIGLVVGVGSLIPFLGVILGLVPACLFAYFDHGVVNLIGVVVVFCVVQGLDGFLLTPIVLGKRVSLHPITLIIAIFIGAEVFGLFGVLLAVPMASVLKILGKECVLPHLRLLAGHAPEAVRSDTR